MRSLVVGLGVQGQKRRHFAGKECIGSVDPVNSNADFRDIQDVPLHTFDAVLLCIPDKNKIELIEYLLSNNKHILVEKPLLSNKSEDITKLQDLAQAKNLVLYTAYNHRFEPHFVSMKNLIESGLLGKIYHCRMFYGNGTARLVRESVWRDQGSGVLPDLGSHLLDTIRFWFGTESTLFSIMSSHCFENRSPDHVIFYSQQTIPKFEMEMTLLSWRNHFTCDIFAENGSAHIRSLCKWGPTEFIHRIRQLPSGVPKENRITLVQPDPTWELEYTYFKKLCEQKMKNDLSSDIWINKILHKLNKVILEKETV